MYMDKTYGPLLPNDCISFMIFFKMNNLMRGECNITKYGIFIRIFSNCVFLVIKQI